MGEHRGGFLVLRAALVEVVQHRRLQQLLRLRLGGGLVRGSRYFIIHPGGGRKLRVQFISLMLGSGLAGVWLEALALSR